MAGTPTSRRDFLRWSALAAATAAVSATGLGACTGRSPSGAARATRAPAPTGTTARPRETSAHQPTSATESPSGLLRIANRPGSIGPDTVRRYEQATGVTVDYYEEILDDQTWLASVTSSLGQHQDIGSDLDMVDDATTSALLSSGRVKTLQSGNIPNRTHLRRELAAPGFDPQRHRSLPWVAGMAGLAYDPALTGRPVTGVADLFDPAFKGRVTMLADLRDGLGMVMSSQGNSPAAASLVTVTQAVQTVGQARLAGQIARFTGNADFADLVSGAMAIAQVRSTDVAGLAAANPALLFVVPDAGSTLYAREMVVPDTTHNQVAAESWMNWIYDRANYAAMIASVRATVVLSDLGDELARISPALAADPLVDPPAAVWARLVMWAGLDPRTEARYRTLYRQVTG